MWVGLNSQETTKATIPSAVTVDPILCGRLLSFGAVSAPFRKNSVFLELGEEVGLQERKTLSSLESFLLYF